MAEFRKNYWHSGKIIAIICLFESLVKFSLSITELVFGHLKTSVSNETRSDYDVKQISDSCVLIIFLKISVFIHSIIFVLIGSFGIICSLLLYTGLAQRSTSNILWYIVFQGISVFHQVFFSFELITIVHSHVQQDIIVALVATVLAIYVICQTYFIKFVVQLYQKFLVEEVAGNMPRPWRVPTVSELLGRRNKISISV